MQARAISIKSVGVLRSYPALFSWAPGDTHNAKNVVTQEVGPH